nr:MAG TPA: hypothetical protein [Caudoviricetes sp.]
MLIYLYIIAKVNISQRIFAIFLVFFSSHCYNFYIINFGG